MIFLPGTDKQIEILFKTLSQAFSTILIIGPGCEEISKMMVDKYSSQVTIIVDSYDSLLSTRLNAAGEKDVAVKMMEYDNTDFHIPKFDLVYAQASVSNSRRNKIVKEIKRILKPEGFFCVGENVSLSNEEPEFIKDIWKNSGIVPLYWKDAEKYYRERDFKVYNEFDLSFTLKEFYKTGENLLKENLDSLNDNEKSYYKKLLRQISHESNAYLSLGGDEYMGFRMFILRKGKE